MTLHTTGKEKNKKIKQKKKMNGKIFPKEFQKIFTMIDLS